MEPEPKCAELRRRLRSWLKGGELERYLPELAALRGVPQPEDYHAEGDAFTHTLLAVDSLPDNEEERVFWAVLLHDIGKASTTRLEGDRWRAFDHDRLGAEMARKALERLGREELAEDVAWLVEHHHFALSWGPSVKDGLTRRQQRFCRHPLFPLLCRVCRADAEGSRGVSRKGDLLAWIEQYAESISFR